MISVFMSYSHKDEVMRDELEVHLASLKRQGKIDSWHDRKIGAGKELSSEIDKHLIEDEIILLLISPYFIASDYCYLIEMKKAMERHHKNEARIIPVILQPCNWQPTPFGQLLAVPKDGKPVSKYPNPHDAYLEVTLAIEKAVDEIRKQKNLLEWAIAENQVPTKLTESEEIRSSNLRVKKDFTQREKDKFLADAFEYIAKYVEGSLNELKKRNNDVDFAFRRIDANKFNAAIYKKGNMLSYCTIRLTGNKYNNITFSSTDSDSGYNESLSVKEGEFILYLEPLGMFTFGAKQDLSLEGAAEYYWTKLMEPLQ